MIVRHSSSLTLIGTVHNDPDGYCRLMNVLDELIPDIITLEFSCYGRAFRTKNSIRLSKRLFALFFRIASSSCNHDSTIPVIIKRKAFIPPAIQAIYKTIRYPFEYLAVRDYANTHKIPFYCIDTSEISREKLKVLKKEVLNRRNIETILKLPSKNLKKSVQVCYKRAQTLMDEFAVKSHTQDQETFEEMEKRAYQMSRRIRNIVKKHPKKKVIHIGGWEHFACSPCSNVYSLLKDLSPQRVLLSDIS